MWRPVSFAADKNRPYPRRTAIVIIVLALFTLLLPLLEGGKKRKFSFLSFRLFLPWKMDASRILEDQIHITSIYISRYLYTRYYRDLIKRREKFAIPLREIPPSVSEDKSCFITQSDEKTAVVRILCRRKRGRIGVGVRSIPGKRNVGTDTRVGDTAQTIDWRWFTTRVPSRPPFRYHRIPVQSELCRFINRVDALTGRGINLCNNLTDPRRIDRKKKRPRSIVERFLEFWAVANLRMEQGWDCGL